VADDWRLTQALTQLRQMVTCPQCGALVSQSEGYNIHIAWHEGMNQYVASVDAKLAQFSDYIINPDTGLQKQIQDRLDTITNYVVAPETGLEPRVTEALTELNAALTQLRSDATAAIQGDSAAITQLRNDATGAINDLTTRVTTIEGKLPAV
jgi:hypothetical protein